MYAFNLFYVTKLQKLSDMTKPRLVKVRALLYILQNIKKRGCAYFDTAPSLFSLPEVAEGGAFNRLVEHGSCFLTLGGTFCLALFVALCLGGVFVDAAV